MVRPLVLSVAALVPTWLFAGCGIVDGGGSVEVRLENDSEFELDETNLFLPDTTLFFVELQPNEVTPYHEVGRAFRIASVRVLTQGDSARLQVIDYVGESLLDPGRYTYILSVFPGPPLSLGLDLEKDS
jgi:hypothetical protein